MRPKCSEKHTTAVKPAAIHSGVNVRNLKCSALMCHCKDCINRRFFEKKTNMRLMAVIMMVGNLYTMKCYFETRVI